MEPWSSSFQHLLKSGFRFAHDSRSHEFVFILRNRRGTGFSRIDTIMLLQTSRWVGSWEIFSKIAISSDRTEPNTAYSFFHSLWLARLIKNSGPEPSHVIDPLLMPGHNSFGISLNIVPWASNVPWIRAKGGPNKAYINNKIHRHIILRSANQENNIMNLLDIPSYAASDSLIVHKENIIMILVST